MRNVQGFNEGFSSTWSAFRATSSIRATTGSLSWPSASTSGVSKRVRVSVDAPQYIVPKSSICMLAPSLIDSPSKEGGRAGALLLVSVDETIGLRYLQSRLDCLYDDMTVPFF